MGRCGASHPHVQLVLHKYVCGCNNNDNTQSLTTQSALHGSKGRGSLNIHPHQVLIQLIQGAHNRERMLDMAIMKEFFKLKPWGPNLCKAWEMLDNLTKDSDALITGLDGLDLQVRITKRKTQDALQLGHQGIPLATENQTNQENNLTSTRANPCFVDLRYPQITLALQLYMHFFNLRTTQCYTRPKLQMAVFFSKAFKDPDLLVFDVSNHILQIMLHIK